MMLYFNSSLSQVGNLKFVFAVVFFFSEKSYIKEKSKTLCVHDTYLFLKNVVFQ